MARNKHPEVTVDRILEVSLRLFMQKGYDNTTIADIVAELGNLSKGAIYHHFKSKDEIMMAIADSFSCNIEKDIARVRAMDCTGLEKLRHIVCLPSNNNTARNQNNTIIEACPNFLQNPRFLVQELHMSIYEVAPILKQFIDEGLADGSVQTSNPKALSEVIILLANLWLNPLVFECTADELRGKYIFLRDLLDAMGVPIFDGDMPQYFEDCRNLREKRNKMQEIKDK